MLSDDSLHITVMAEALSVAKCNSSHSVSLLVSSDFDLGMALGLHDVIVLKQLLVLAVFPLMELTCIAKWIVREGWKFLHRGTVDSS